MCRAVNAAAVEHLAEACGRLDCPLVQISTDYVFGGPAGQRRPHRESDPPAPQGVYAHDQIRRRSGRRPTCQALIVRTCGLYARPSHRRRRTSSRRSFAWPARGRPLRVVADQHCTPSYVPHVARAILFLAGVIVRRPAPWGIYHVTNRGATTWHEFACEIVRLAGLARRAVEADHHGRIPPCRRRGRPTACWTRPPIIALAGRSCPTGRPPWPNTSRNFARQGVTA